MKKKALIISCFDWYEKRIKPIQESLSENYEVTIISSDFDHILKKRITKRYKDIIYVNVPSYKKNLSLKRIFSHLIFGKKVSRILTEVEPDLIYLLMPPNNTAQYCLKYKKKRTKVIYIIDIIDMWPESFPLGGLRKLPIFKMWANMRNKSLLNADYVVTECTLYQEQISHLLKSNDNIDTLHLFKEQNEDENSLVNLYAIQKKSLIEKRLVLGYLGSINHIIDIEGIKKLLVGLKQAGYEVDIHIIGDGESKEVFLESLNSVGASIHFYGKVFDEVQKIKILGNCDYGLNMMKNNVTVGLTIKSIDYFSYGLPIINNIKGDTWKLVEEENVGVNYNGDINILISEIQRDLLREKTQNTLKCYQNYFTKEVFEKKIKEIILKL